MKINAAPREGSYAAALTEEQRTSLYALLRSGITLAEAREKAPPWPDDPGSPEKDNRPSMPCLGRIRWRLRVEEKVVRIQNAAATRRATRRLLKKLVTGTDQEQVLDEVMTLIGEQVIEASLGMESASTRTAAAWLLLRRADQRRFDQRTAIFKAQAAKAGENGEDSPLPPLSKEEEEERFDEIFGTHHL
ncbi:MAG: hypothetical protein ABSA83_13870 [Verrucomicrobiota bacterium]|jgi:hypothetical protein